MYVKRFLAGAIIIVAIGAGLRWNASRKSASELETTPRQLVVPSEVSAVQPARTVEDAVATAVQELPVVQPAAVSEGSWREKLLGERLDELKVSAEEVARYLEANGTNAQSLAMAFHASGNREYLRMAATNFPNDPFVQYNVIAHDLYPDARTEWLGRFKEADPQNALANYLSARDLLKEGKTELALQELVSTSGKEKFNDFTREKMVGLEEVYLNAGRSAAEAKAVAMSGVMLPSLAPLKGLGQEMQKLQQQYAQAGDAASAEAMVRMGIELGRHLDSGSGPETMLHQLVGLAIERLTLGKLDPAQEYDFLGGSVGQRMSEIEAQKKGIRATSGGFEKWLPTASEPEIISYFDRVKIFGEAAAMRWLRQRGAF